MFSLKDFTAISTDAEKVALRSLSRGRFVGRAEMICLEKPLCLCRSSCSVNVFVHTYCIITKE